MEKVIPMFFFFMLAMPLMRMYREAKPVLFAQDHCQQDHQDHQGCDEQQVLPGKKALGLALVSAKAKKFTHGNNLLFVR